MNVTPIKSDMRYCLIGSRKCKELPVYVKDMKN